MVEIVTLDPADVQRTVSGDNETTRFMALLAEIQVLAKYIDRARQEIAVLSADDVVKCHVITATDELDAIIRHTAEATTTILDACESIERVSTDDFSKVVPTATSRIYEACSFQDITGQRVGKIVRTLKLIEARIVEILNVFSPSANSEAGAKQRQEDTSLLNGPQQPGAAMDQDAIDALLECGE